jgi:hypothetical protein
MGLLEMLLSYPPRKEITVLKDVSFTANFGQKDCYCWSK